MSRIIQFQGRLVTGINSTSFEKGFNPATREFDKTLTDMINYWAISTAILAERIYQHLVLGQSLNYEQEDMAVIGGRRVPEFGISTGAWYASKLSRHHGGNPLLLVFEYPQCRMGLEDVFDELSGRGYWIDLKPAQAKVSQILGINEIQVYRSPDEKEYVSSLGVQDITSNF
jgi:hypothetical protein